MSGVFPDEEQRQVSPDYFKVLEAPLLKGRYFTDADLAILGSDYDKYIHYVKSIRKEYKFYPDFVYNPGRKKVLEHFIQMTRIYKTDFFFSRYEEQARKNMNDEIRQLIS